MSNVRVLLLVWGGVILVFDTIQQTKALFFKSKVLLFAIFSVSFGVVWAIFWQRFNCQWQHQANTSPLRTLRLSVRAAVLVAVIAYAHHGSISNGTNMA
jgi:hypothetical protein